MKAKVIQTTDRKYLWTIYEVSSPDKESLTEAIGGKFSFDRVTVKPPLLILQNSNYTVVLKIIW